MNANMSITRERIRKLIDDSGLTRKELAEQMNCDVSTIGKHYNGDREVNTDFIVRYAEFFHVSTDYLLGHDAMLNDKEMLHRVSDYVGLSPKSISILSNFLIDEEKMIEEYTYNIEHVWMGDEFYNQKEILDSFIEEGYLTEIITVIADYCWGMESDISHINDLLPLMESVKKDLQSGVLSRVDPLEGIDHESTKTIVQLHYYELGEVLKHFIRKKYSALMDEHYAKKKEYQILEDELNTLYGTLQAGEEDGNNQETQ